jgi:hypothetical protein
MSGDSTSDHRARDRVGKARDAEHTQMLILISLAVEEAENRAMRRTAAKLLEAITALDEDRAAAVIERTLAAAPAMAAMARRLSAANDR